MWWNSPLGELDPYDAIDKAGSPIWDNVYPIRMRAIDRLSTEHLQKFGVPTTFDPAMDQQLQNEQITLFLTIDAVFEHWRGNRKTTFVNNKDSEHVYHIVNNYLKAWETVMRVGINIGSAPLADLIALDEFAQKLFVQARMFNGPQAHKTADFVNTLLRGRGRAELLGRTDNVREEGHRSVVESLVQQLPLNEQAKGERKAPHRWRP